MSDNKAKFIVVTVLHGDGSHVQDKEARIAALVKALSYEITPNEKLDSVFGGPECNWGRMARS